MFQTYFIAFKLETLRRQDTTLAMPQGLLSCTINVYCQLWKQFYFFNKLEEKSFLKNMIWILHVLNGK